jgi:ABC-type glycerol-3-phosphate transport system permease component
MTPARGWIGRVGELLAACVVAGVFLVPLVWMVAASLKPDAAIHADVDSVQSFVPAPLTAENYDAAISRGNVGIVLGNTIAVVVLVAAGGLLFNVPAAYALARLRFPGRDVLFVAIVATMIVPLEAIVIPLFLTVRPTRGMTELIGLHGWTLAALSVPFVAKAFNIYLLRQAFLGLPRALEEAAVLDGASWRQTFWHVALPNVRPALVTVVLLDFVIHWNDFLWPLVICEDASTRTIQLGLGNFFTQPPISWGAILAYAVIATVPLMVVFVVGQRWIVRSLAPTGIRE